MKALLILLLISSPAFAEWQSTVAHPIPVYPATPPPTQPIGGYDQNSGLMAYPITQPYTQALPLPDPIPTLELQPLNFGQ